jgi:hypothetical protein
VLQEGEGEEEHYLSVWEREEMILTRRRNDVPREGRCWPPKIMCVLPHAYREGSRNEACVLPPKIRHRHCRMGPTFGCTLVTNLEYADPLPAACCLGEW